MKIVIATPILYDQTSPFNHLFKDIIGGFLEDGNHIVRLVAVENINEKNFKHGFIKEKISYRLYKRKKSSHSNIVSRYIRDNFTGLREAMGILKEKNVDVLFEDICYASVWPVLAAKMKGIKVVAMLQDVWPDNAVQSDLITEQSLIYKFFEFCQRVVYKKADRIICISDDIKVFIASKGIKEDKIEVIYNWGYSDKPINISWNDNVFVKKYKLSKNMFYAVYAGNIGKMQNVEIVVNAAQKLQDRKDIRFLIIGDGARKKEIEKMVKQKHLKNVDMFPFQPTEFAIHIYSAAGVNLIPLVNGGTKTALPSKTGVVLSCGKPVIVCVDRESQFATMIKEKTNGSAVNPDDFEGLAEQIKELVNENQEECSYQCFMEYFQKKSNIEKYKAAIKK